MSEYSTPSTAVIEKLATATNTDARDLPQRLHEVVDTDALDHLFADRDTEGRVEFEFCDHHVTVASDGEIELEEVINNY